MLQVTRIKVRWFYALMPYRASEAIFSLLFPLFLLEGLQAHVGTVGLLTALISLTSVPGAMLWGTLSDHLHKRRLFLVLGCVGSGLCLAGMASVNDLPLMALLCLAYGVFAIASAPIPSALIMETMPQDHWDEAFGTFNKIGGWGWVSGLAIGGWFLPLLHHWLPGAGSMRVMFLVLAATTLLSGWWVQRTIPEPVHRVHRNHVAERVHRLPAFTIVERALYLPRNLFSVLRPSHLKQLGEHIPPPYRRYLLASLLLFGGSTVVFTLLTPFLRDALQLHTSLIFVLSLVRMLAATLCFELAGRWEQHIGPKRVQLWAVGVRAFVFLGFLSLWVLPQHGLQLGVLLGVNILAGVTWSLLAVSGPVLVGLLATPGHRGAAMGVYSATKGVSSIVGASAGGYLAHGIGYAGAFAVSAGLLLLALAPISRLWVPQHPDSKTAIAPAV